MTLMIDSELFREQMPKVLFGSMIGINYRQIILNSFFGY